MLGGAGGAATAEKFSRLIPTPSDRGGARIHMTNLNRSTFIVTTLILCLAGAAKSETIIDKPPGEPGNAFFPTVADAWSPNARFLLKNVDTPNNPDSPYSIYLTDMKTGVRTVLYSYARRAEILWSPASDVVAINDFDAHDDSQCFVFPILPHHERINVREELLKSRRPDSEKRLVTDRHRYDHNYAHGVRWIDARTLLFVVEGHSSHAHEGFRLDYAYRIGDGFRLLSRTMD
jgi:hypothetical protein